MHDDPTELSRDVAVKVVDLAACLSTDVEIDPVQVIVPLVAASAGLHRVVDELNRATISVDEGTAAALRRAGDHFLLARDEIVDALRNLPRQPDPGSIYGKRRGPEDAG